MKSIVNGCSAVLEYLLIFIVISISSTVWVQEGVDILNEGLFRALAFVLAGIWIALHLRRTVSRNSMNVWIGLAILMAAYMPFHIHYLYPAFSRVFIPIILFGAMGVIAMQEGTIEKLYVRFVNVMVVFAAVSLFFYTFVNIFPVISPTDRYSYEWSWVTSVPGYYDLYYNAMGSGFSGYVFARNCGVFPEAPMFMYPLCMALGIHELLLSRENQRKLSRVILVVTILSTFSSTGFLVLTILYGYKIFIRSGKKNRRNRVLLIPFGILIAAFLAVSIIDEKLGSSSYSIRTEHVLASLKCFWETNFLGCGIGNAEYVEQFMSKRRGISCGLPYMLAQGGVFWGGIFLYPLIRWVGRSVKKKNMDVVCFAALFFVLLFMTACQAKCHTWFVFGITAIPACIPKQWMDEPQKSGGKKRWKRAVRS